MSTRRKSGNGTQFIGNFYTRLQSMDAVQDHIATVVHMSLRLLDQAEASVDHWVELAGIINVCGMAAIAEQNDEWYQALWAGGAALKSVKDRHERVKGRFVTSPAETQALRKALKYIEEEILPGMPIVDFLKHAKRVDEIQAKG